MILIIAEKPSLARAIQTALEKDGEKFTNKGEYYQSKNYYCTSAFGHLYELKDMAKYTGQTKKWTMASLPFFPEKYQYVQKPKVGDRVKAIKELLKKSDEVIHAGDADREGQIIVDIILDKCGWKGKTSRVWISALEPTVLLQALKDRKPNKEYASLHDEGITRMVADWSYGINLTRYATLKVGHLMVVGRVVDAIVDLIYEREMEIRNFTVEPYWQLQHPFGDITIESKYKLNEKSRAEDQEKVYNAARTFVKDVKKRKVTKKPPKLFSQTKLQNACSTSFGWKAEKTLDITQKLYEKGYTTYPRTDSEYLTVAEKKVVKEIIKAHNHPHMKFRDTKEVFDDSKVDSHSAIIPTKTIPSSMTDDEEKCYRLIFNRFLANFYDTDLIINRTDITVEVADKKKVYEDIKVTGDIIEQLGWGEVEKAGSEKVLPNVQVGDDLEGVWSIAEKETKPPAHYTVATLNNKLKNPYTKDETSDDEDFEAVKKGIQIGTSATRAGIIDKAISKGYISLTKNTYYLEPDGETLINNLRKLNIDMSRDKTVQLSMAIKSVSNGEITQKKALNTIYGEIEKIIAQDIDKSEFSENGQEVGKCPLCGSPVVTAGKAYKCSNKDCRFFMVKYMCKKQISPENMRKLLEEGDTGLINGFVSKNNKKFNAHIVFKEDLENEKYFTEFRFE